MGTALMCMNFLVDNIFYPFYLYQCEESSGFAEILPARELEPTRELAVEDRARAYNSSLMGTYINLDEALS